MHIAHFFSPHTQREERLEERKGRLFPASFSLGEGGGGSKSVSIGKGCMAFFTCIICTLSTGITIEEGRGQSIRFRLLNYLGCFKD